MLIQPDNTQSPQQPSQATFSSIAGNLLAPFSAGDATPQPQPPPQQGSLMVFGGEFNEADQKEIASELDRFAEAEAKFDPTDRLKYIPVFLPPDVSKGHYEGFCKKSKYILATMPVS